MNIEIDQFLTVDRDWLGKGVPEGKERYDVMIGDTVVYQHLVDVEQYDYDPDETEKTNKQAAASAFGSMLVEKLGL